MSSCWASHRQRRRGTAPRPHPMPSYHNTTVSNALRYIFGETCFLSIMEYTGNLQGKMHLKHFFLKERLVYLLCSLFLSNLWTKEAPLIHPRGPQAAEHAPTLERYLRPLLGDCFCSHPCRQEMQGPGRGVSQLRGLASGHDPSVICPVSGIQPWGPQQGWADTQS